MGNTKIGSLEAISLILITMVIHTFLNIPSIIVSDMSSSAILNVFYVSIIAIILSYIVYKLLNKFPTFDILDISNYVGGKFLKFIIGVLFFAYFIFFSSLLLRNFVTSLNILYFSSTKIFFIISLFIVAAIFCCLLRYNSIFRSNLFLMPIIFISIIFLFVANFENFSFENIVPVFGDGIKETFWDGIKNLYIFQGISLLYFLPPTLKNTSSLKKICIISIIISSIYLLLSIACISLMFNVYIDTDELLPLFSCIRYIEFNIFFQRLDPIYILIWILSFISYISIIITICSNIVKKIVPVNIPKKFSCTAIALLLFISLIPKNYAVCTFLLNVVYKYAFFILIIAISFILLFIANIKRNKTKIEGDL